MAINEFCLNIRKFDIEESFNHQNDHVYARIAQEAREEKWIADCSSYCLRNALGEDDPVVFERECARLNNHKGWPSSRLDLNPLDYQLCSVFGGVGAPRLASQFEQS
ncbi:hypothetical protein TNCV_3430951 [Trichonephila clavipes]|nr:hypothetical protein TNCV_3430951 [Trichonephila clavipes]